MTAASTTFVTRCTPKCCHEVQWKDGQVPGEDLSPREPVNSVEANSIIDADVIALLQCGAACLRQNHCSNVAWQERPVQ